MKKLLLIFLLAASPAAAQSVQQSGSITPGHVPYWVTNGVIGDGGTAASGNLTSLGTTGSGPTICANSGPITGPYNQTCLQSTSTSGGIAFNNFGGATGGFTITINGSVQTVPVLALPITVGDLVCIANNSGNLNDCGIAAANLVTLNGVNVFTGTFNCNGICELHGTPFGTMSTQNANAVNITGATEITGLPSPTNAADAATKQYVDNTAAGLSPHSSVVLGTTTALPANTYNNGTSGVGATLTSTCVSSCPAPTIDGTAAVLNERVLIKNEAAAANNGIYTVTQVGTGTTPYILTRATDANTAGSHSATAIGAGTYVLITAGSANVNTGWVVTSTVATIGVSAINWAQFNTSTGVTSLNGLTGTLSVTNGGGVGVSASGSSVAINTAITPPQGRLTLQANTPVMTANQVLVSTLRYDCYHGGNTVPYYNGSVDTLDTISACEVTTAMAASSTGQILAGDVFDVWWEGNTNHNICIATNGSGGGWSADTGGSTTARGTGYSKLDTTTRPYITNANLIAFCYNGTSNYGSISANELTYLGTIYAGANGATTYQIAGSAANTASAVFLWNAYNRVALAASNFLSGSSYPYTNNTYQVLGGSDTSFIQSVSGLLEEGIATQLSASVGPSTAGTNCFLGIGVDTDIAAEVAGVNNLAAGSLGQISIALNVNPGVGYHFVAALGVVTPSGHTCTVFGAGLQQFTILLRY